MSAANTARHSTAGGLARFVLRCGLALGATSLPSRAADPTSPARTLTVFAAASLSEAFKAIGAAFEQDHPGVKVQFNFGGSSTLAQQIHEGAPADVFASADRDNMHKAAVNGHLAGAARIFARNRLVIAVTPGNPNHIASLADLAEKGLTLALAAPQVPAGKYAAEAFDKAGVALPPASQELDVRAVLNKVAMHEADAGIVYVTDIPVADGKIDAVAIPDAQNVTVQYPIAVLEHAAHPAEAQAFTDFVLSAGGQSRLKEFGFISP